MFHPFLHLYLLFSFLFIGLLFHYIVKHCVTLLTSITNARKQLSSESSCIFKGQNHSATSKGFTKSLFFLTCTPVYRRSCSCVRRMQRRRCTSWASAAMSHRSPFVSPLASSPSPLWLRASTSASSWTHSYGGYERKTPASLSLVRPLLNEPAVSYLCHVDCIIWFDV